MPGSSVSSCHMCHMHNHHPEGLLRTNPLRSSRNRSKPSHLKYTGNRAYHHHHNGYTSAQEDGYVRRSHSSGVGMGRLSEHSHPGVTRSRSNSLSGYQGEVSILPDGRVSNPYGLSHGTSTRSLDLNPPVPVFLEPRNCSLPRLPTSHHHSHIVPQADLLLSAPPPRSRSGTLTRTPAPSVAGQDNSHDYYLHLHRQRFKEEKRKHRFNLQTVMLIGCYTILVMIAIVVGVVVCYQNGWLGLGKQEKIQSGSAATGGTFTSHPDSTLAARDRNKILNQSTNQQNEARTRLNNNNNPTLGSDNRFSVNSNTGSVNSNKHLNNANFAGFFPSNPVQSSGSARDIFTHATHPSHGNQIANSGLQNDHRSNQGNTRISQNDQSLLNIDSRNNQINVIPSLSQTHQTEPVNRHLSNAAAQPTLNNPVVTQREKARSVGSSNQNTVNIGTPQSRENHVLQNDQPKTHHRNFGVQNVRAKNSGSTETTQNLNSRLPQESRSSLQVVDGVIPIGTVRRPTAPPLENRPRTIVFDNVDSNAVHFNVPRIHSGVTTELHVPVAIQPHAPVTIQPHAPVTIQPHAPVAMQPHIPVVRNQLNPVASGILKDTGSLTTQELLDLLAVRRMKDLINSGGNEKNILEVLRSASPSGDIRLEAVKEEKVSPTDNAALRQRNRQARLLITSRPPPKLTVSSKPTKSPVAITKGPTKEEILQSNTGKTTKEGLSVDPLHGLNANTSFEVITSLINNTVNGAILRLLNSRGNFDNAQSVNPQDLHLGNSNPHQKGSLDSHDLSFLLNSERRIPHDTTSKVTQRVSTPEKLSFNAESTGGQRASGKSSDLNFVVGSPNIQRDATVPQNVEPKDLEGLKNLLILQKLFALNNDRARNSQQIPENPSALNELQTLKSQSKISQSQAFPGTLPLNEFKQTNSVARLGIPSEENTSEVQRARQHTNVSSHSNSQTQSKPQKIKSPDPSFAVLVKSDGKASGQNTPKSLFPSPSRSTSSSGIAVQSEPVQEQVAVVPGSALSRDPSTVLRAWTHMDKSGTLSHGQVHSDGSFSFTNCRPIEICN